MDRKGLQIGRTALCLPILLSQQMLVGLPVEELCGAAVRIRIRAVGGGGISTVRVVPCPCLLNSWYGADCMYVLRCAVCFLLVPCADPLGDFYFVLCFCVASRVWRLTTR
jgi:hypothetical protein